MGDEPRVVQTPGVCGGDHRLDGTRMPVRAIVGVEAYYGTGVAGVLSVYPHLTPAQVQVALDYYQTHRAELDCRWAADDEVVAALLEEIEAQDWTEEG